MRLVPWRTLALALLGALAAAGPFAGYSVSAALLHSGEAPALGAVLGPTLVVALLGAGAGLWVAVALERRSRRLLDLVRVQTALVCANPAPNVLRSAGAAPARPQRETANVADGVSVAGAISPLAANYRKALEQVARLQEKLEQLEQSSGAPHLRGEPASGRWAPTHFVVGSSRHRMVVRLAPNLHIIALTQALQQFLGYARPRALAVRGGGGTSSGELSSAARHPLVARSFLEVVHPDDARGAKRALREALKDGEGHDIRFRVLINSDHADDELTGTPGPEPSRHVQMDVMTCYDDKGAPNHLRCHLLDITDRVLTERNLVRSREGFSTSNARLRQTNEDLERLKESYRDLYHHAPVLYFSLDDHARLVAVNESMLASLGYSREELLNQPYSHLLPAPQRAAFEAGPEVMQRPGEIETQWVKQDGTIIDVWIGTTTIHDADGQFFRSRSAASDVTERNRLANALRAKAEEVGRANDRLRRTNQELEEFTYVVSHDLKEPLRTLEAFSNFLAQDYGNLLGAEGHEYITHLIQASRRLGALIDDLLTLSRAGRVLNVARPFSYAEVVQVALGDLRDLIQRKQAVVRVEGPFPLLSGDAERVTQLLTNLISNGLKYNKGPAPEVALGVAGQEDGLVTLFVRDNGAGIDPAYHEQIFRIFRRLHRRDEVEGTGAGLAICKKIVEAHGGRIWVKSAVGEGATFFFTLPVRGDGDEGPGPVRNPKDV